MNYEKDVKEIRKDYIKSRFPKAYQKMVEDNTLTQYLEKNESEYYECLEKVYDKLCSQSLKNKRESILFTNAERLAKEVELKILARDKAAEEVLFRPSI